MSEEEILDVLECSEEFNILSSDSEASNDDALPSLFPPRKRLRPISDEESTQDSEPSSPDSNYQANESKDNSDNSSVDISGPSDLREENNDVQGSEQGMEDPTVSSETDPFHFSSEGEDEEEEEEPETEEE
ncbi:acidic leucine-rich nuclear phosphoprotein 32 family member B-like [Saccostrea cucullata]|uniref:acidic leucine-rich nuclear phosphoprotein 32 family member B-like n=1 Tax=Saccostrea cuccullata TaxID=36930 RepID=UPI002ED4FADB